MQLNEIAERIASIIRSDPFPDTVEPDFLARAVRDYPSRGGKRIRPALVVWSALLHGGTFDAALYPAAAVEVFHNWTLVHDDVIDRDDFRRGTPTCHRTLETELASLHGLDPAEAARAGVDFAILTGDLQQSWANDLLLRSTSHGVPAATVLAMLQRMQRLAGNELIAGEALDVDFSFRRGKLPSLEEYWRMIDGKTGALLALSLELGTLSAIGPAAPELEKMNRLGRLAGRAFQLRDDDLGIFGDERTFGKPVGADLKEGKATLLLLHAFTHGSPAIRQELLAMADGSACTPSQLDRAREIFADTDARAALHAELEKARTEAAAILRPYPDSPAKSALTNFLSTLSSRTK